MVLGIQDGTRKRPKQKECKPRLNFHCSSIISVSPRVALSLREARACCCVVRHWPSAPALSQAPGAVPLPAILGASNSQIPRSGVGCACDSSRFSVRGARSRSARRFRPAPRARLGAALLAGGRPPASSARALAWPGLDPHVGAPPRAPFPAIGYTLLGAPFALLPGAGRGNGYSRFGRCATYAQRSGSAGVASPRPLTLGGPLVWRPSFARARAPTGVLSCGAPRFRLWSAPRAFRRLSIAACLPRRRRGRTRRAAPVPGARALAGPWGRTNCSRALATANRWGKALTPTSLRSVLVGVRLGRSLRALRQAFGRYRLLRYRPKALPHAPLPASASPLRFATGDAGDFRT